MYIVQYCTVYSVHSIVHSAHEHPRIFFSKLPTRSSGVVLIMASGFLGQKSAQSTVHGVPSLLKQYIFLRPPTHTREPMKVRTFVLLFMSWTRVG